MKLISILSCVLITPIVLTLFNSCNTNDEKPTGRPFAKDTIVHQPVRVDNQQSFIDGEAGRIFVDDGGEGKTTIILLHSFGGSTVHWQHQLKELRKNYRAIAIDLRGHGQSAPARDFDYSVIAMAKDIAAVADSLRLGQFVLAGHSMGGSAAIAYAASHVSRVSGLLLTGTPGRTSEEQSTAVMNALQSDKYKVTMEDYMQKLLANALPSTVSLVRAGTSRLNKDVSIAIVQAQFVYDPVTDLRNYHGPVMIISPSSERPEGSLHSQFPDLPYHQVEGTSHWIHLDKPAEFNKLLHVFLTRVEKK